jgi:hypothetical protein
VTTDPPEPDKGDAQPPNPDLVIFGTADVELNFTLQAHYWMKSGRSQDVGRLELSAHKPY